MKKIITTVALGALFATSSYAVSVAGCTGCHGQYFEKAAMGKSKIVKDMSYEEIKDAMMGYKNGTYGDTLKGVMEAQVKHLSDEDIEAKSLLMSTQIGVPTQAATEHAAAAAVAASGGSYVNLNEGASDDLRIQKEDLNSKKSVSEESLGLRKTDLYSEEKTHDSQTDYDRPAPGASKKFERAFKDAPPMIPHSVEGLLPVTKMNNQCLGCHMPEVASSVGSTAIPPTHFTNYRPETTMKGDMVLKEGQVLGSMMANTSDVVIADAQQGDTLYQGRFNCTQCHAPQSKVEASVANTFRPDYGDDADKAHSSLMDHMNDGIDYEVSESAPFMEGQ
ncbi:MAG: Nitrate reductase cytochrome c550-type subunit [uncultured Sulfurovum sp.]|uniref:Periplasmic nitrate reductase, electron transfer subunit n=1 Tax=uncultured Sulfurovum sp. TaxID=269237 RepID=A0A6S6TV65_9BACT|nr:MAG: Nitrate reductase cytochrome c550-type subunit [uncultured Sulfurovum sp.]